MTTTTYVNHIGNLKRRQFMQTGLASMALATGSAAIASPAPEPRHAKSQPVYLDYTQEQLDEAYDQAPYAPNLALVIERWAFNSDITRSRLGQPQRISYGSTDIEALDLFRTAKPNAPIHIFLHGGAWRASDAKTHAFIAEAFVERGAHVVIADFASVIQTGGNLQPLADQIRRVIKWAYKYAPTFGGDRNQIHISGHSSGAHLAAVALTNSWQQKHDLPNDLIKSATFISGMFDLKPVRLSSRSNYLNIDDTIEHQLSPQRHVQNINAKFVVVYGSKETPEFIRQSRDFAQAATKAGKTVELIEGRNYNHFEIIETLANPYGIAGHPALKLMGI